MENERNGKGEGRTLENKELDGGVDDGRDKG